MKLQKNQNIRHLLNRFPECGELLYPFLPAINDDTSIEELAAKHAVSQNALLTGLERYLKRIQQNPCNFYEMRQRLVKPNHVNIAGYTHFLLHDGLCEALTKLARDRRLSLNLNLFRKHEKKQFQNYLALCTSPDDLPEMLIGKGFSSLTTSRFFDKFIRPGYFTHPLANPLNGKAFQPAALADSMQSCHAFGVDETLMMYDSSLASSVPMPRSWNEILTAPYQNALTQMGKSGYDHFGFNTMLYLYQAYGNEGIARFAANVKAKQHFTHTVKNIGRNSEQVAPVNIMHRFAAGFIRSEAKTSVQGIETHEGNPVACHFFLLKKQAPQSCEVFAHLLFSEAVQQGLQKAGVHPLSAYAGSRMRWIGWDTLRSLPLPFLKDQLAEIAFNHYKNSKQ